MQQRSSINLRGAEVEETEGAANIVDSFHGRAEGQEIFGGTKASVSFGGTSPSLACSGPRTPGSSHSSSIVRPVSPLGVRQISGAP